MFIVSESIQRTKLVNHCTNSITFFHLLISNAQDPCLAGEHSSNSCGSQESICYGLHVHLLNSFQAPNRQPLHSGLIFCLIDCAAHLL